MSFDIKSVEDKMSQVIENLKNELAKIRTGRANPNMVNSVKVMAWGNLSPLSQVAQISVPEARQLLIKPFDPSQIVEIEKAINNANLGVNPSSDGEVIRITIAPLTEETRKKLSKDAKAVGEEHKVRIRSARQDAMSAIKKDKELTEDAKKSAEKMVQDKTDMFNKSVDEVVTTKEKDIMTI